MPGISNTVCRDAPGLGALACSFAQSRCNVERRHQRASHSQRRLLASGGVCRARWCASGFTRANTRGACWGRRVRRKKQSRHCPIHLRKAMRHAHVYACMCPRRSEDGLSGSRLMLAIMVSRCGHFEHRQGAASTLCTRSVKPTNTAHSCTRHTAHTHLCPTCTAYGK